MCVQYRGGCSVPWWVLSTVGGYHEYHGGCLEYRGGYLEYHGGCLEYRGGYLEYRGGYLEYRGVFSTMGDIMIHEGIS